jgi:hypothetical protein
MTRAFQTQIQSNIFDLVKYICRFVSLIKTRCLLQSIPPELVCCPAPRCSPTELHLKRRRSTLGLDHACMRIAKRQSPSRFAVAF